MPSPILLFVYNRPDHTRKTIEALQRNLLAKQSDLYVFSDHPKDEAAKEAVGEVRQIISDIRGFSTVTVIKRDKNLGLAKSVISGVTEVINKEGRVIVLEDDLVTSPQFLEYMNQALRHYERDPKVFSIGGYQFPERTMKIPKGYPFDAYSGYRCCSWGWATWKDRWDRIDWEMKYFDAFMADAKSQAKFNLGGADRTQMLVHQREGKVNSWAIRFCYAHFQNDMRCIYPAKSLVNNIGLDNSGVHCGVDPSRQHDALDENFLPKLFCPAEPIVPEIAEAFYRVFSPKLGAKGIFSRGWGFLKKAYRKMRNSFFPPDAVLEILVVNTMQKSGGAAKAAWRNYLGIRKLHPSALYWTLIKEDHDRGVIGCSQLSLRGLLARYFMKLDRLPMLLYPKRSKATFTPALFRNPFRTGLRKFRPRLVHLHWVAASFLKTQDLRRFKVPMVWTLHDTWAFTGGCHYPGTCEGFFSKCGACPQLKSHSESDLSRTVWLQKQKAYQQLNITFVSPSRWLAETARKSSLLANHRVEVIPNGLDTQIYQPLDKKEAKAFLGLTEGDPVLLFGAEWLTDPRKGGDLLVEALKHLDFPCTLLNFGEGNLSLEGKENISVKSLGRLQDEMSLAVMYSAADVFICPSREDNLPNTVAEALSCGTPCAAFAVNGLPEMISHQQEGWLAKPFDAKDLAEGIRWIVKHPNPKELQSAARRKALAEYSLDVMANRYSQLYGKLMQQASQKRI